MTADRLDNPEEGRLLRGTLIALILMLASGMLFGAMSGVLDREDEIEEAHNRALRLQNQVTCEQLEFVKQQADEDSPPTTDAADGDPQPDPSRMNPGSDLGY
jgi:hypothetical protein